LPRAPEKDPIRELVRAYERIRARAAGTSACPDASVLAAYFEQTLAPAEVTRWQAHFADCVRCREQLAALARVDAADSSSSGAIAMAPWWRTHRWFPVAAMATAAVIAIAVIVRERASREAPEPEMVALSESPAASNAPAAAPAAAARTTSPAPADALTRDDKQREKRSERKSDITGESAPNSPQAAISGYGKKEPFKEGASASSNLEQPASKTLAQQASHAGTSLKLAERAPRPAAPVPEGVAPLESFASRGAAAGAIGGAASQVSGAPAAQNQLMAGVPATSITVEPPDHSVAWMIGAHGAISHYAEGGPWSPQESNVTSDLLAGAAISRSVCWVVGRGGTILRTLDGLHWDKIAAPTGADIVGVTSDSGTNATVTTGDHRTYTTSDSGATWHSR
jgi:hypothetical protein